MAKTRDFEKAFTLIEKEKLIIEKRRTFLSFEMAFFFPLFALLFLLTSFAANSEAKLVFYLLTIAFILADLVYSFFIYSKIREKEKELEKVIEKKLL